MVAGTTDKLAGKEWTVPENGTYLSTLYLRLQFPNEILAYWLLTGKQLIMAKKRVGDYCMLDICIDCID